MNSIVLLVVAVLALFVDGIHGRGIASKFPQVEGLRITDESVKRHRTERYMPEMGFAVRRGMPFDLDVAVNMKLADDNSILLQFDEKTGNKVPHFTTKITAGPTVEHGSYVYRVEVNSKEDDPIGEWNDMIAFVASKKAEKAEKSLEGYVYAYPFTVVVVDKDPDQFQDKKQPVTAAVNAILDKVAALEQQAQAALSELEKMD